MNFYLCNKHRGRPSLKLIWSKKRLLLRKLNYYYYFKNCNNSKKPTKTHTYFFHLFPFSHQHVLPSRSNKQPYALWSQGK